ncbi:GNAT family N-acetyltransferase [Vagococcus carniphilus]|uniref:GNAT family N-acetyltransferase n=1 Tax=Vagococcus carniphilus TaxID=218144 RepID=A0AAW8U3T9_9ENTE|nr:GNAT family N-acetyltransferase [Vagococcus carniphilus]MDT2814979.1 GNAT family N-acetyltransferase [Vagococcus carniphilus]MDT2829807.1 GNAT family N-acetyltransferase [Vagococcus carniphilus]MDT2834221.1 GNAT family N-acetyltransferase [Vagococcus carniphilus]MDT2839266.1 GNAT family N-acetyltransferase [Vagococcus carniphilus]MDT2853325.1 GNAT family N-acetyltransferase [Vagococcus carniphilus]
MTIRHYEERDKSEVITLIKQTIQLINQKDYTPNQIKSWSEIDWDYWDNSLKNHLAIVSEKNKVIVGFSDMTTTGFLDRLFVHHDYQNQGIASQMLQYLELKTPAEQYSTYASITAKPFFERNGYKLVKENIAKLRGEAFLNYYMTKDGIAHVSDDESIKNLF